MVTEIYPQRAWRINSNSLNCSILESLVSGHDFPYKEKKLSPQVVRGCHFSSKLPPPKPHLFFSSSPKPMQCPEQQERQFRLPLVWGTSRANFYQLITGFISPRAKLRQAYWIRYLMTEIGKPGKNDNNQQSGQIQYQSWVGASGKVSGNNQDCGMDIR